MMYADKPKKRHKSLGFRFERDRYLKSQLDRFCNKDIFGDIIHDEKYDTVLRQAIEKFDKQNGKK